jgi:N-acetylmuramoyl-L-alanine amidase
MKKYFLYLNIIISTFSLFQQVAAAPKYKIKTVFIDPGHGGSDPGSLGAFSHEADVALKISLKFGAEIQKNFPDIKVVYARTTDQFVDLYERANMANKCNADLFICIHLNSAGKNHGAYGCETYTMGLHRTDDNFNVAKRENSVILLEDDYKNKYQGFDPNDPASYIMFSMMQNANLDQSVDFAGKVQEELGDAGRFNRGVKQAGFAVLVYTKMPSVLIETGFITNPEEERFLNSEEGSNKMANSIFKAFENYKVEVEGVKTSTIKRIIQPEVVTKTDSLGVALINHSNYFKIQFYSSSMPLSVNDERLAEAKGFTIEQDARGKYIYLSKKLFTKDETEKIMEQLKKNGFKDAFLVSYLNNKRIE